MPYVVAAGPTLFNSSFNCGTCVEITGAAGTAIARVVDQCPECAGGLDMIPELFEVVVGPLVTGIGPISWETVPCPLSETIAFAVGGGASVFFPILLPRYNRYGLTKLEIRGSGGAKAAHRAPVRSDGRQPAAGRGRAMG